MLNWLFMMGNPMYGGFGNMPTMTPPLREPNEPTKYVEERLHSLELACAALWELLKQKNGYSDQELMDLIHNIDDQRKAQNPAKVSTLGSAADVCPKCGHKMLTHNHTKCLWCGADLPGHPF